MDNATRKHLLQRHRQSGFPGSILDVFKAYDQGIDLIGQFEQQNNIQVAKTPEQQQQGLRPAHQAGNVSQSMAFPDVPPNTPFNTVGMKAPINIEKYDEQGHLVKSYENVPPGITNLPMGPHRGTVIETPANMQGGGPLKEQVGPRVPIQDEPVRSTESMNLDNDSTYNVRGWLAAGAPGGIDPGDGEFHGASVDPNTGMWLKSKEHPTAWKEHLGAQLSPDPFFKKNVAVVNPEGYFGDNQLQYVPRKYQSAGEVKPYRATSKEDYRYRRRMYDDSLNHHLATLKQIELMGQKEDWRGNGPQVADKPSPYQLSWTLDALKENTAKGAAWSSMEEAMDSWPWFDELDEKLYKYYTNDLGFSKDVVGLTGSPDVYSSTIEPSYTYYDGYAQSPYYPAPKQPIAPFNEIQRLKPLGLSGSPVQPLAERDIIRSTRELPKPGRQPELIYKSSNRTRTEQEPNYYRVWDDKGKQWSTRPVEPEELDRYLRENKRVEPIVTPPISFKDGGPRKFQNGSFADRNYLPPIAQAIEKAGGFDQYQANFAQAETLRDLNSRPTISQGTFDVDEAGNIVEDNPSFLEMAANPMATARTLLDPSVEGRPSRVEFDKAKARGNMAGQIANDMVNRAAWVNYGVNVTKDLGRAGYAAYQGEGMDALRHLGNAGLNALGAIPGTPGAVGVGRTAIKYGRNPYLLNANRANKYDFHSIGDKPHFWRGYETPITDPSKLSPSSNFGGYLDDLRTAERLAERPVAQQGREESRALFGEFPAGKEANDFAGTVFKRMDEAASDARTAFNQRHAPFLGDEIGRGAYGRVSQFKNNPDYVFKIGRSEGANAKPNFLRALEPFQNRSNIATPLQKANFPLKDPHFGIRQGTGEALVMRNLNSPTFGTQQFAGLNARQAKALQIKTARQLRDAGIGLDFAADAGNLASSNVSPNLTNFFDLHYRPGLQHDSRYLANQYLRKKLGGPRRYQSAGGLEFGQTGPDFETYGPGLRIDGETYQASRNTGATRIPTFSDGTQRPILLGAAEVYNEPINSVPDGHTPETKALAEEGARGVAERRNQAAGMGLAAVGDFFSAAQRYGVSAPLALAMGKTPNLSPTPLLDRAVGAESPNAFPSEILGIQNPYGATATDILTDPMAALSLAALGRQGTKAGQNYLLKRQLKKEMGSGAASLDPNKLKFEQTIKRSGELNNPRVYTMEDQLAFQEAAEASDVGISEAFGAVGQEFYSPDAKKLYNMTPGVVRGAVDETLGLYGGKQAANVSADLAAQNQDRIRSVVSGLYSNADDAAVNAANQELRLQHMSASSVLDPNSAQLPFRPVSNSSNAGEDIADRYLSTLRVRAKNPPNVSLETRDDNVLGIYRDIGKELNVTTPSPLQADMNKFLFGAQSTARHEAGHHVVTHMTPLQVEELNKKLISPITRDAQYTGMPHNDYLLSSRGSEIQARALESRAHFMNNSNMPGTDLYSLKGIEDAMNKVGNDPAFAKEFLQEAKRLPGSQTNEIFDVMKVTGDDITDALNYLDIMKYATGITGVGYGMSQAAGNTQYKKGGGPRKLQSAGERRVRTMGMPGIVDVIREMPEDDPAKFADTAGTLFNLEWNNSPMAQQMLTDSYMRSNRASDKGNIFYALDLWGGGDLLNRYIAKDQTKQRTNERNKNVLSTSYDPVLTEDEFLTMLGRDDTSIRAFFRPSTSSTSYNPYYSGKLTDKLLGTGVHERSHASDRSVFPSADVDMMQGFRSSDERGGEVEWTTDAYREYVQKPTETRARIMDIRRDLYNRGIDVFNSPVTKEQFDNYLKDTWKNNYPYGELNTGYSKDAIFKMLNTIAYEGDNNVPQNVAKRGGKRHMRKYFKLRK